jgi:hypothetical protein
MESCCGGGAGGKKNQTRFWEIKQLDFHGTADLGLVDIVDGNRGVLAPSSAKHPSMRVK